MSMELTVQPLNLPAVTFNKAEMAAAISAIADRYKGLVVTDKAEAKKDRTEVSRLLKQIDAVRKQIKAQYEAPLKAFEADIKEIAEPLKASGEEIDRQIKAIEEQERNERKAQLEAAFSDIASLLGGVSFDMVFDPKWLNASVTLKKAVAEMKAKAGKMTEEFVAIKALDSPHYPALIQRYMDGATLADVLAYNAKLTQTAQTFAISGTETPQEVAENLARENPRNEYTVTDMGIQVTAKPSMHRITVSCTDGQFDELLKALDRLGCFFVVEDKIYS